MCSKAALGIGYWILGAAFPRKDPIPDTQYLITFLVTLIAMLVSPGIATAHSGGKAVLADVEAGPYRLFAYVQPEPVVVGDAHVAVAVTIPAAEKSANGLLLPVTDAQVFLHWAPQSQPTRAFRVELPVQSTAGDTFYELDVAIPFADLWHVTLAVNGAQGQGEASFELPVAAQRSINWWLVTGAGVALILLVGLMIAWQRLQRLSKE